ncbi:TIGR00341 family protein [uncultured Roseibium sp.]|uniref:TIGR00341 family protein n=1 Tax=uncultured Roseibium sp. TaxID=1936171 RepID=UPI003217E4FD
MSHQYVHVIGPKDTVDDIIEFADRDGVTLAGISAAKGPVRTVSFLTTAKAQQPLLDDLQSALQKTEGWQIAITPVDAVVTKEQDEDPDEDEITESREALLAEISKNAGITPTSLTLVAISTVVAALGMIENNVAAIIGAMVIAPLLGPLLGSILGVSLGERGLIIQSAKASAVGILLAVAIGGVLGIALPFDVSSKELASRAAVGFDDIALALAAGAAAALSLTAGAASILVGVMVAVALMPPAAAIGLFLGKTAWLMAGDAALLLAVNLAALHLSGQIVFLVRGIKPRTRYRQAKVKQAIRFSLAVSGLLLLALALVIGYKVIPDAFPLLD